ncbi:MAG: SMC-Scp complex subunit ScpB [Oscillospiraceae bacterium]|nr:SMC-Scp complex subunit ScpB [Oscillospiraceae bacterium]
MSTINYKSAVEAILFASGSSVDPQRISVALEISQDDAVHYLEELKNEYENSQRGITIVKLKDSYQMVSVKEYAPQIRKVMDLKRNTPLSQAALEVLAVIAYNQPVTKSFVEQIRGVDCSGVIGSLTAKDLIEEKGRLELPGRPLIYGTTENFLRCFNISSIEELPPLPEDNQKEEQPADPTLFDEVNSAETVEGTVEEIIEQATAE